MTRQRKNCMFQYAHKEDGLFGYSSGYKIVEDTELITIDEAKELWRKYLPDFIKHLQADGNPEMALWIECQDNSSYGKTLAHIDGSYETDGTRIWANERKYVDV